MIHYCDWCEEKTKIVVEVGDEHICESCAQDLRSKQEQITRLYNVAEKFEYPD